MKQDKVYSPIDGCTAAAHIAYYFSDNAIIYPITPSSPMAEYIDAWAATKRLNAFDQVVSVDELNSEAGAVGALHGALAAGALTTTYTSSQGLLLMIPNLYKMAGEHLPAVIHVAARTIATHSLSIHGDHSDIMAVRQTGVAIVVSPDVQEAMDFAIVAHIAAIKAEHPVIHAFDGFRTSHTIKKVEVINYENIKPFVPFEEIKNFRLKALNPEHPKAMGSCQGPPVWLQASEADNSHYNKIEGHFIEAFQDVEKITGRKYEIFEYYGAQDATDIVVLMGSGCITVQETIDHLNAKGQKTGAVLVRLFRPFSIKYFISKIPMSVKRICILDRCKEQTAAAEPLRLDVICALIESGRINKIERVIGGRYGQSSKDFIPADVVAIFENLKSEKPIDHFICSITDDVTFKSLERKDTLTLVPEGTVQCMFFGQGSDGTVGANKNAIKIIADNTQLFAQGYFDYDSFKAGGLTTSHLRFGPKKIGAEYYVYDSDFTACSQQSYWNKYQTMIVNSCRKGSILLLNTSCKTIEDFNRCMPKNMRAMIAAKNLKLMVMDASDISDKAGLPGRINSAMQTAFFMLSGVLPQEKAIEIWKKTIVKTFKKKGESVVNKNLAQVDATLAAGAVFEVKYPTTWGDAPEGEEVKLYTDRMEKALVGAPDFIRKVMMPTALGQGNNLPVSAFTRNGDMMTGTTRFYKRGIAVSVPTWQADTCIQCMQCAVVCPHAVIRPYLATDEEIKNSPIKFLDSKNPTAAKYGKFKFAIQASPLDCTGCGVCVKVCPTAAKGTLVMHNIEKVEHEEYKKQIFLDDHVSYKADGFSLDDREKAIAFRMPHFEFHGACAGCGETAYITQFTRLFGQKMIIANATGCSSIYGFSFPYSPYNTDKNGHGPAWANSLFEDNAEFGYGMVVAISQRRDKVKEIAAKVGKNADCPQDLKQAITNWLERAHEIEGSEVTGNILRAMINQETYDCADMKFLLAQENQELFRKPVIVIQGGDGWAYDIDFGGVDHILASGLDFTIMIIDTEVYSNTGGQKSKATPLGAVVRFASAGKRTDKKDIAIIAMSYSNAYVASINMGANYMHAVKTIREAVEYNGPSLIVAYCPCIEHGLKDMSESVAAQKLAAQTGYWLSFNRYPGKKFNLVTPKPSKPVSEFLNIQNRFVQLSTIRPEESVVLAQDLQKFIDERFVRYQNLMK
ncbi:Pyruvate-flavodoxin_oxidoreductase 4 [Hexamita inflata]|uniref:Pyruvate-flavodoxin_oxidoreductase 4 n=1 Tax=Hexamita inflata TaxID=28002 RepID=A0ABP1GFX0_9EUKA